MSGITLRSGTPFWGRSEALKKSMAVAIFLLLAGPVLSWSGVADATINFNGTDKAESAVMHRDGGVVIAGSCGAPSEQKKFCILKISKYAQKEWSFTGKGEGEQKFVSIIADKNGGFTAPGNIVDGKAGSLFMLALSDEGQKIFEKYFPGKDYMLASSIAQDAAGSYYISGSRDKNAFIMKVSANGEKIWGKKIKGQNCVSSLWNGETLAVLTRKDNNIGLEIIDSDGNTRLSVQYGGFGEEQPGSLALLKNKGYLIVGSTKLINDKASGDFIVIKADASGNAVWQKTFGTQFPDKGVAGVETAEGRLLVIAETAAFYSGKPKPIDYETFYLMLDKDGNIIEEEHFGHDNHYGSAENQERGKAILSGEKGVWYIIGNREYYYNTPEIDGSDFFLLKQNEKELKSDKI